jgi:hypothetical protein
MLVVVVVGSPVVVVVPESNGTKTQGSNTLPHSIQGSVGGGDTQRPSLASRHRFRHVLPASGNQAPNAGMQYQTVPPLHDPEQAGIGGTVGGGTGGETNTSQLSRSIGGSRHPSGQSMHCRTPLGSRYQRQFPSPLGVVLVLQSQGGPVVVVVVVVGPQSGSSLVSLLQLVNVHSPSFAAQKIGFKHWQ